MELYFAKPEDFEEIRGLLKSAELLADDVQYGSGHFLIPPNQEQFMAVSGFKSAVTMRSYGRWQ